MTDQEERVAVLLGEAWNEYLKLPVEHPNEQAEFCGAIHACQDKVLARSGRRRMNGTAPSPQKFVLCPGHVISQHDGDRHYIDAQALARLYELRFGEWETLRQGRYYPEGTAFLHPRRDGAYGRPAPAPAPQRPSAEPHSRECICALCRHG